MKWAGLLILLGFILLLDKNSLHAEAKDTSQKSVSESAAVIEEAPSAIDQAELADYIIDLYGEPPTIPKEPHSKELVQAVEIIFGGDLRSFIWGDEQTSALMTITESGDPRLAWLLSDFMRISGSNGLSSALADSAGKLLNITADRANVWEDTVDHLIAWNIPSPPDYLKYKKNIYTLIVPEWDRIFVDGDIDWRHVSWGGVGIDNREFNMTDKTCNCIPAADNPEVTDVANADWLNDDDIVFGVEVNGEFRAYPRRIMEVREMVNDTLGGRDLGIPYCTLCGSAQAYFTDEMPEGVKRPVLRTSGLLIRSNKVMYDVNTFSVFDTFLGQAVTGPLAEKKVTLKQAGVVTTEWGEWKAAHPQTTVLKESLALGRDFDFRNNRDAHGPIFPVGNIDPRLSVHDDVVGLISASGIPIAFHTETALTALKNGDDIIYENIRLVLDGGGIRAIDNHGKDLGSHQAFWFAWSQFHHNTKLWPF